MNRNRRLDKRGSCQEGQADADPSARTPAMSGHFTTRVTVITYSDEDGAPHGATVNAFTAASLDPPLVLVSLDRRSKVCRLVESRPFTVNVLEAAQKDLALRGPTASGATWPGRCLVSTASA
jgi:flavin reductase (DIM6/NTAB) family NADH-FMN oxidoreductase RutF